METHGKNLIICDRCADEIVSKGDLITVLQWPELIGAYHVRCYGERARGGNPARTPLNSQAVIWLMVVFSLLCLGGFLFYTPSLVWIILALIIPILRLSSWLLIERKIS